MTYIKKVIVFDARSSPEARAKRVRQLRNMANMTREQLCQDGNIAMASLKRWELGYYGGLPVDGAKKIIECTSRKGIVCSLEWLLHEVGQSPLIDMQFRNQSPLLKSIETTKSKKLLPLREEEHLIINELLLFRQHHAHAIDLKINDDGLFPKYQINDYVAGICVPRKHFHSLLCQDCIIQIQSGQMLLRNLRRSVKKDCYNLVCTNEQTTVQEPILYEIEVTMAAVILRHYRMLSQF